MATQTMEGNAGAVEVDVSGAWRVTWIELDEQGRVWPSAGPRTLVVMARDCSDAVIEALESGLVGWGARVVAVRREGGAA